jgi:hypothetical protein
MPAFRIPRFHYHLNPDGSYDSICLSCFDIVGTGWGVLPLSPLEAKHTCQPIRLYQCTEDPRRRMASV